LSGAWAWMGALALGIAAACGPGELPAPLELPARAGGSRARPDRGEGAAPAGREPAGLPPLLLAEAEFRAGERLRAAGRLEEARRCFEAARAVEGGGDFAARAALELAALARRQGRAQDALAHCLDLLADPAALPRRREEAELQAARLFLALGQAELGRDRLARLARGASDARTRLLAYDEWSLALILAGDLEAAAGALEECRVALRETARERTALGASVRAGMDRLRSPEALARALRERARSRSPSLQQPMPKYSKPSRSSTARE
jgi:tetratricopeptide (TPR) repeat protein